jgi:ammonia channel protein AmtB
VIPWSLIIIAGALTGLVAAGAAFALRWQAWSALLAGVSTFALIVAWRTISNTLGLNDDFVRLVSPGDLGCLVAGAIGPGVLALLTPTPERGRWLPAAAAGVAGFIINVIIL